MSTLHRVQRSVTFLDKDGKHEFLVEGNGDLKFYRITPASKEDIEQFIDMTDESIKDLLFMQQTEDEFQKEVISIYKAYIEQKHQEQEMDKPSLDNE